MSSSGGEVKISAGTHSRRKKSGHSELHLWGSAGLVLLFALVVRVAVFAVSSNGIDFHFNAYDHALFTWHDWMQSDRWVPLTAYGPLHFYLLRLFFVLFGFDPEWTPRLLSLVFGVASIWPLMRLTHREMGNRAAIFAGLIASAYPLAVRLSVVSLEVTLFHFTVLMAIDAASGSDKRRWYPVLIAAFWLTLASATRFEAWLLIPLLCLVVLIRAGWIRVIVFGALASIFPLVWMYVNWRITGNPTEFAAISAVVQKVHAADTPMIQLLLGWPTILLRTSTIPVVILAIAGIALAIHRRQGLTIAVTGLGLFALFVIFAARGTMAFNETKYIAIVGLLIAPFAGLAIAQATENLRGLKNTVAVVLAVALVLGFSGQKILADNRAFAAPADVSATCAYLATQHKGTGRILLGVRFQGYFLVHGGQPYERFLLVPGDDATGKRSVRNFWDAVEKQAPCLMIHNTLPDRLDFQDLVPIDGINTTEMVLEGHRFRKVFRKGDWMVLSVTPENPPEPASPDKESP